MRVVLAFQKRLALVVEFIAQRSVLDHTSKQAE